MSHRPLGYGHGPGGMTKLSLSCLKLGGYDTEYCFHRSPVEFTIKFLFRLSVSNSIISSISTK